MDASVYIVGDIHGQLERLAQLLVKAKVVSDKGAWIAGGAHLWFMGDFFDRGPFGIEALEFAMRLQDEALAMGGQVDSILGNHDLLVLAALRFRGLFLTNHQRNGGDLRDLKRLSTEQALWLSNRPTMARIADNVLAHADTDAYLRYGKTVTQVNRTVAGLMAAPDALQWDQLLEDLSSRHAFDPTAERSPGRLVNFLATFGGRRLIHGHTPISYVTGQTPADIVEPYVYAQGRCVNVDGGMYLGGPGFLYRIEAPLS